MAIATAPDLCSPATQAAAARATVFDLAQQTPYREWRARKLAERPRSVDELRVPVADASRLTAVEHHALLRTIERAGMALYALQADDGQTAPLVALGAQLGLKRIDANWLADPDGLSRIAVSDASAQPPGEGRADYIPYTDRAIRWHTDGYYHPPERRIRGMLLHCVRPSAEGGVNRLLDPELAYIALRDESPRLVRALMRPDAMTIPPRLGGGDVARAEQSGPVFSVVDGGLHMRYTARTRSIAWHTDADVAAARRALAALLDGEPEWALRVRLDAGCGLIGHNVLHDRSAFTDHAGRPRLLYRARYLDRAAPPGTAPGGA